jgi:ATP phosphoribosyltransferase regulatory subunit
VVEVRGRFADEAQATRAADSPQDGDAPEVGRAAAPLAPPAGMRDLLAPESLERRRRSRAIVELLGRHGYDLVTTPPFEHAEVMERGLGALDRRDLLRFVEPESGEVALLRPDITPQIARVVATRLRDRPGPWRLCYDGTVVRRRRGRARRQRQIAQIGAECVGLEGPGADAEVVNLAVAACGAAGLRRLHLEIGHVSIARAALAELPPPAAEAATEALAAKDATRLEAVCERAGAPAALRTTLRRLLEIDALEAGDPGRTLARARRTFATAEAHRALDALAAVVERLHALGVGTVATGSEATHGAPTHVSLALDLAEVRGFGYYTGVRFSLLARGPGEPVGGGGRYDDLLGRFGMQTPATGFALDLEHLDWALAVERGAHSVPAEARARRWVVAASDDLTGERMARRLRARGSVACAVGAAAARQVEVAVAFACAWGYDLVLVLDAEGGAVVREVHGEGGRQARLTRAALEAAIADADSGNAEFEASLLGALAGAPGDVHGAARGDAASLGDVGSADDIGKERG